MSSPLFLQTSSQGGRSRGSTASSLSRKQFSPVVWLVPFSASNTFFRSQTSPAAHTTVPQPCRCLVQHTPVLPAHLAPPAGMTPRCRVPEDLTVLNDAAALVEAPPWEGPVATKPWSRSSSRQSSRPSTAQSTSRCTTETDVHRHRHTHTHTHTNRVRERETETHTDAEPNEPFLRGAHKPRVLLPAS